MSWAFSWAATTVYSLVEFALSCLEHAPPAIGLIIPLSVLITLWLLIRFKPAIYTMLCDEPEQCIDLLVHRVRVT